MPLKIGDVVTIYEDVAETTVEGDAKLVEKLEFDADREKWLVEFTKDHKRAVRWIKKQTEAKEFLERAKAMAHILAANPFAPNTPEWQQWRREIMKKYSSNPGPQVQARLYPWQARFAEALAREIIAKGHFVRPDLETLENKIKDMATEYQKEWGEPESKPTLEGSLCDRLQAFICEEENGATTYEALMRELREGEQSSLSVAVWSIVQEEREHAETLRKIKSALCP